MQDAVEVQFAIADEHVLSTLFHFRAQQQVAFVDSSDCLHHLGEFVGDERFDAHLDGRLRPEFEGVDGVYIAGCIGVGEGGGLGDGLINALNQH